MWIWFVIITFLAAIVVAVICNYFHEKWKAKIVRKSYFDKP